MLKKTRLYVIATSLLFAGVSVAFSQGPPVGNNSYGQTQSSQGCTETDDTTGNCGSDYQLQQQQQLNLQNPALNLPQGQRPSLQGSQTLGGAGQTEQGILLNSRPDTRNMQNMQLPPDPPTEFQRFVAATIGQMLPVFGANLFRNVPSTFSPNDLAPATPEYVIEADDELRVRIWGQINYSGNLLVDRSGNIYIPQVGAVHVAGQPFSSLDQHLRQTVSRVFRNFDLSVDLGRIRPMQVYVTGFARRPGAYTVSSLSTLVDALFASGGPGPQGSLRHIQVKRAGNVVADFDFYGLLIRGDKSHDVRLLPEDVIYIPPAGSQVAITGSVRTPGIYELREGETLGALIESAGSTSTVASQTRISIDRLDNRQYRTAMEASFDAVGLATLLENGDILRIYPIVPAYQKTVVLRGSIANPGRFGWHQGMHLSDLIPDQASLLTRDYWWQRSHLGLPAPEFEPFISAQRAPSGTEPVPVNPRLTMPGTTAGVQTGGLRQDFNNLNPNLNPQGNQQVSQQPYQEFTQGYSQEDASTRQQGQGPTGSSGSLATQATNTNEEGAAGSSLRKTTVRLTPQQINWDYAVIERTDPNTLKTTLIPFDLGKLVLAHDTSQNLELQPSDIVTIFSQTDIQVPLEQQTKYVDLEGEFVHAGIYSVQPGETLRDLIQRAGGFTANAYIYGAEFDRESTRRLQQQRLDEYVQSVSMEADRGTQALAVAGTGAQSSADVLASREVAHQLVDRLRQIRATGRIVLQFKPTSMGLDSIPALALENGDRFTVPSKPATINVVGAVYNQNSFVYENGRSVRHYLQLAGGPNRNADWHYSFIIRADGSVVSRPTVKSSFGVLGSNPFESLSLNPGDTVVIPDKTLRPTKLRNLMDWTQIFSQLALGAAAINVL